MQFSRRMFHLPVLGALAIGIATSVASTAAVGTDNASATQYSSGWTTGTDGFITGDAAFGAWNLTSNPGTTTDTTTAPPTVTTGFAGFFIGDSTANGFANINSSGNSFGMYAHSGNADATVDAFRPFGGQDLSVGQTFAIDLATNYGDGNRGLDIKDSTGTNVFNLNDNNQTFNVTTATTATPVTVSTGYNPTAVIHVTVTQTDATDGTWTVTRGTDSANGTYTGVASQLNLYMNGISFDAGGNDFFANNLSITPEPATLGLLGLGAVGLLRRRK